MSASKHMKANTTLKASLITVSFKITPEQMEELRVRARKKRMSISAYLRSVVFPEKKQRARKSL